MEEKVRQTSVAPLFIIAPINSIGTKVYRRSAKAATTIPTTLLMGLNTTWEPEHGLAFPKRGAKIIGFFIIAMALEFNPTV